MQQKICHMNYDAHAHNSYHIIASIKELTRQIDQLKEVLEKHECNQAERHRHIVTMLEEIYDHTTESIQINEVHSSSGQPTDVFSGVSVTS